VRHSPLGLLQAGVRPLTEGIDLLLEFLDIGLSLLEVSSVLKSLFVVLAHFLLSFLLCHQRFAQVF